MGSQKEKDKEKEGNNASYYILLVKHLVLTSTCNEIINFLQAKSIIYCLLPFQPIFSLYLMYSPFELLNPIQSHQSHFSIIF